MIYKGPIFKLVLNLNTFLVFMFSLKNISAIFFASFTGAQSNQLSLIDVNSLSVN